MRNLLLTGVWMVLSITVFGKEQFGVDLGVGAKVGLNVNRMNGEGLTNVYHTDPHAGFFVHVNKHRIGVQIESIWTQTTIVSDTSFHRIYQQYYNNAMDSLKEGSFRFSMISIPILLNLKLTQKLWIQLGPQYMGNITMVDKNDIIKSGVSIIEKKNFNFIGGLWFQLGGKAPLLRVNAGLRYVAGLNNMNSLLASSTWKSQMIQLHIGIGY